MKILFYVLFYLLLFQQSFAQSSRLDEVKRMADARYEAELKSLSVKYNKEKRGLKIGDGIIVRGCESRGKTLIMKYDVSPQWEAHWNGKAGIIASSKDGQADSYFKNGIDTEYQYYKRGKLYHTIHIDSKEYISAVSEFWTTVNIKSHPKSMGVDLQFEVPVNWSRAEGDRPHVVCKFTYETQGYMSNMFMVMVMEGECFISRNEVRELLSDPETARGLANEYASATDIEILDHRLITVDRYPIFEYTYTMNTERGGLELHFKNRNWLVFYEDKMIQLSVSSMSDAEFDRIEPIYTKIIGSVMFPEQYVK